MRRPNGVAEDPILARFDGPSDRGPHHQKRLEGIQSSQFSWHLETAPNGERIAIAIIMGERVEMSSLINHPSLAQRAPSRN